MTTTINLNPKFTTFTIRHNELNGNYIVWAKNPQTGDSWFNVGVYPIRSLEEAEEIVADLKKEKAVA
jgi:hypothetical protein